MLKKQYIMWKKGKYLTDYTRQFVSEMWRCIQIQNSPIYVQI